MNVELIEKLKATSQNPHRCTFNHVQVSDDENMGNYWL